jgi:hypothetical protein
MAPYSSGDGGAWRRPVALGLRLVGVGDVSKRILVGRKLRSSQLGERLLPKRVALPVFASDALSSVAYAPDEVFIMLGIAGAATYTWSWKVGLAVAVVMLTVVASYRQTVHAYPSGGGDYEVATVNLGRTAGVTVASALLIDYVLTVAVSVSAASQYAAGAAPPLIRHQPVVGTLGVLLLTALNHRGDRSLEKRHRIGPPLPLLSIQEVEANHFDSKRSVHLCDLREAAVGHVTTSTVGANENCCRIALRCSGQHGAGLLAVDFDSPFHVGHTVDGRAILANFVRL